MGKADAKKIEQPPVKNTRVPPAPKGSPKSVKAVTPKPLKTQEPPVTPKPINVVAPSSQSNAGQNTPVPPSPKKRVTPPKEKSPRQEPVKSAKKKEQPGKALSAMPELLKSDPTFLESLAKKPMKIANIVRERYLEAGCWVQTYQAKGSTRLAGEWGVIKCVEGGNVNVDWSGNSTGTTNCQIMSYSRTNPADWNKCFLAIPRKLNTLVSGKAFSAEGLEVGDKVQSAQYKSGGWTGNPRQIGEWGTITDISKKRKVKVDWTGGLQGVSDCLIMAYTRSRRRLVSASPVMRRLLQAIHAED